MLNKQDYEEWLMHAGTIEMFRLLKADQDDLILQLSQGTTLGETAGLTAQQTAALIGEIRGLSHILNKEFFEFNYVSTDRV